MQYLERHLQCRGGVLKFISDKNIILVRKPLHPLILALLFMMHLFWFGWVAGVVSYIVFLLWQLFYTRGYYRYHEDMIRNANMNWYISRLFFIIYLVLLLVITGIFITVYAYTVGFFLEVYRFLVDLLTGNIF